MRPKKVCLQVVKRSLEIKQQISKIFSWAFLASCKQIMTRVNNNNNNNNNDNNNRFLKMHKTVVYALYSKITIDYTLKSLKFESY